MSDESKMVFYMLEEKDKSQKNQFIILTRQKSINSNKKYFWQKVGQAFELESDGEFLLNLQWYFYDTKGIYMKRLPISGTNNQDIDF